MKRSGRSAKRISAINEASGGGEPERESLAKGRTI